MSKLLLPITALLACSCAYAQQPLADAELEAPMQALDDPSELNTVLNEKRRSIVTATPRPDPDADEEGAEDEEEAPEVEEKNAFSDLKDDFEHDDVDIYNAPDLDHEDDFEEDEEVDQEEFVD